MAMEGEFAKYLEDVYSAAAGRSARRSPTSARSSSSAPASPGCCSGTSSAQAGLRRRPLLREGRRRRRHVVLEPLSRHRLRRRVVQLPPAARGDGVRPDDEVRVGLRDLRVLPEDGRAVRLLRPLPVPHHGRAHRVGRGDRPLDGLHRPRRRDAGAVRDPRQRHPHDARSWPASTAWRRSRASRSTRRAGTTTSTCTGKRVGIIGTGATAVQAIPELAKVVGELYVFQRTPSTIDVRDQRATTQEEIETLGATSRAGRAPGAPASPRSPRPRARSRPTTTTSPGKVADYQGAQAARAHG